MTIQCCMCKRVRVGDAWQTPGESPKSPSSTYCPPCFERYSQQIAIERDAYKRDHGALVAHPAA